MIKFIANTRHAEAVSCDDVTTTSVGIPVQFCFSDAWEGTQKIAIFKCGEAAVDVALTSDETVVPAECLEDPSEWLTIGVYGARPDGTVVIPTIWVDVAITKTGAAPSGVDPSEPTPSWVAQVQEMASDALAHMENMTAQAATLPAGSSATASWDPDTDALSLGIPKGDQGVPGQDGADGRDATITVGSTTTGAAGTNASVTNTGTPSAAVLNFTIPRGNTGAPGQDGADGADGFSPVVTVTSITGGHQVAIQDATQTQTFNVMDGQDGVPGVSPEVTIATITGGHSVTITDADHPGGQTFNVMDGVDGAVTSVNGQTGDVVLDADDVGAATMQDIIDQLPVDSVSGSIASFPDGYPAPVESLSCAITPVQDLHGQSSPYPAGGGKNKLPLKDGTYVVGISVTLTVKDSVITASGTAQSPGGRLVAMTDDFTLPAGTYYIASNHSVVSASDFVVYINKKSDNTPLNSGNNRNFTISEDTVVFAGVNLTSGVNYNGVVATPMLNVGNTAEPYAPYSNICPISGHTQAVVTRTGKNLADGTLKKYIATTDGNTWWLIDYATGAAAIVPIVGGVTYTITRTGGNRMIVCDTAETPATGNTHPLNLLYDQATNTATVTASANAKYLVVILSNDTTGYPVTSIQVEVGSSSTPYEAYTAAQVTIDLDGTRYVGNLNVLTGVLTVTAMLWTAPSNNWSSITRPDGRTIYYHDLPAETIDSGIASDRPYSVSDTFGYISELASNWYSVIGDCEYIYNVNGISGNKRVWIRYEGSNFSTVVNGAQFVFLLQTPLSVQLDAATLATLLGANNVWSSTNGNTSVTYRANIQKYIQKLLGA